MTTTKIHIGDILENRETRRKGKQIKIIDISGGNFVTVENVRNADGAILNSVGKQYTIREDRILDDYRIIYTDYDEDVPMTPEEEEEAEALASDNLRSAQSLDEASLVENHDTVLISPWPPFVNTVANYNSAPQEDEDVITPEQEADLHNALKTVGYYKLPDRDKIVADVQNAIDGLKKSDDENFDLSLDETVELVFDYIRSID